jgi:hypothetical protein
MRHDQASPLCLSYADPGGPAADITCATKKPGQPSLGPDLDFGGVYFELISRRHIYLLGQRQSV